MNNQKKPKPVLMMLIASLKIGKKAEKLMGKMSVPVSYHVRAMGTASEEYLDIIGLGGIEKQVVVSVLPENASGYVLKELRKKLYLGTPNTGVAFTIPITAATSRVMEHMNSFEAKNPQEEMRNETVENNFSMIMAFVNQGYSEEVMAAAKPAGASGGTVFHSRRAREEDSKQLFGISVQPEREIVMILASSQSKKAIMSAINESCGMHTSAQGTVLSVPVDQVEGLNKD